MTMYQEYGTHQETLKWCARQKKIVRVLEFGAGLWSTPLFLDKNYFPDVAYVLSLEFSKEWADKVREAVTDPRLEIRTEGSASLEGWDLIFIDSAAPRETVISLVLKGNIGDALVVLHDYEMVSYQVEIKQANAGMMWLVDASRFPWTAVGFKSKEFHL